MRIKSKWIAVSTLGLIMAAVSVGPAHERSAWAQNLEKAWVGKKEIEQAAQDERVFKANAWRLPKGNEAWFVATSGCAEVLVTAPHATAQTREGSLKVADSGTGSLAMALGRLTGARLIYTTLASPSDPNFYDDNGFKEALASALKEKRPVVVLDLHASDAARPYDVDFGTMNGKSLLGHEDLLTALSAALRNEGLINQSLNFFPAATSHTDTRWAASKGVPAIQLEISETWLDAGGSTLEAHRFSQLLQGLARYVTKLGCSRTPPG